MSYNELPKFGYIQAKSVSDAVSILDQYEGKARSLPEARTSFRK